MRRLQLAIIVSLLIHATFLWLSRSIEVWFPWDKKNQIIELTLVNQTPPSPPSKQGVVVRNLNLPDLLKTQNRRNQYNLVAEELQRVKEQLRALRSGVTQNRGGKASSPLNTKIMNDYKIDPSAASANSMSFDEVGESTIGIQLPDGIKAGLYTSLNTDRYLYSSYYNRVEELTLPEWAPILDFITRNPPNALTASIHRRFVGWVEIWSKPSGEIITVKLLKSFGIREFDQSFLEAFRRARVIPNPPKDKIGPDGIARVEMGGYITLDPKVLSRR